MAKGYIKRPIYLDRIIPFVGQNLIKVLIGQRRVGKRGACPLLSFAVDLFGKKQKIAAGFIARKFSKFWLRAYFFNQADNFTQRKYFIAASIGSKCFQKFAGKGRVLPGPSIRHVLLATGG